MKVPGFCLSMGTVVIVLVCTVMGTALGLWIGIRVCEARLPLQMQENTFRLAREEVVYEVLLLQDEAGHIAASEVRKLLQYEHI